MSHFISTITLIDPKNHSVYCKFNGIEKVRIIQLDYLINQYSLTPSINNLREPQMFSQVFLDSYGTLAWTNGFDFCPDVLYGLSENVKI